MTDTPIRRTRTPKPSPETTHGVSPQAQVEEVAQVTTRYSHPVYVASQRKLVHPGEVCPVIVDGWVRHQLADSHGSLIKA